MEIGIEAARLLLRRIAVPDGPAERILIAPQLMVRAT
jgi:DNA-binding LacI/PurR family transcriptional regulator